MARYKVQGPDGRTYIIEGPDGATQEEVISAAQSMAAAGATMPTGRPLTNSNAARLTEFKQYGDPELKRMANPTGSGMDNFFAGVGKSVYDTGRGIGQLAGMVSEEDVARSRQLDAPLTNTTGGQLGQVAGTVAQIVGPSAVTSATAKGAALAGMARTAKVADAASRALMPVSLPGNAAQGAALGYIQPIAPGESRIQNAGLGAAASTLGYLAPGMVRGAKAAFIDPLTDKGNERILARALNSAAEDPSRLLNPSAPMLPGYQPTLAEAVTDPGIAQFQRSLINSSQPVANAYATAQGANNLARVQALETLTPSVASATARRQAATAPLYDAARAGAAVVDDEFKALMSRPSIKEGIRNARKLAAEEGVKLPKKLEELTGQHLQYIDQALRDQIGAATNAGAKGYASKLIDTQAALREWMEKSIPEYMEAQRMFRDMSREVDQAKIAEQIRSRAFSNSSDLTTGAPVIRPDSAKGAIRKIDATAEAAGVMGNPASIMTQGQKDTLAAVVDSLDRYTDAQTRGMARGQSATAQNLAGMNALSQIGLPSGLMNLGPVGRLAGVLDTAFKVAGVPERLQARLATIVTNPQEAQRIIAALPENDKRIIGRALQAITSQQSGARIALGSSQAQN